MVRSRQAPPTVVSRQLKVRIEVDLTIIATCDNQEEDDKNLKFSLEFTRGIRSQEREVDDDQVEMNITCDPKVWYSIPRTETRKGIVVVIVPEDDYETRNTSEGLS